MRFFDEVREMWDTQRGFQWFVFSVAGYVAGVMTVLAVL